MNSGTLIYYFDLSPYLQLTLFVVFTSRTNKLTDSKINERASAQFYKRNESNFQIDYTIHEWLYLCSSNISNTCEKLAQFGKKKSEEA